MQIASFGGKNHYICNMKREESFDDSMLFRLYLCTCGSCEIIVNGVKERIEQGDAYARSPIVIVSKMACSDDFRVETIIEDEIEVFAPIANTNFEILQGLLAHNKFTLSLDEEEQEFLLQRRSLIAARRAELATDGITEKQQKLLRVIVMALEQETVLEYANMHLRRREIEVPRSDKDNSTMIRFIFLLFRSYRQHRDVAFYASSLNLSHNHFTRIIKGISRRTPSEWIAIVTINQAKRLLRNTNLSIKDIARELSFPEQFTFRKYFKHHTGLSPKAYRFRCMDVSYK